MTTIGDLLDAIVACKTEEQAKALILAETDRVLGTQRELVREQARAIVMSNIGYLAGYLDRAEAKRVLELFGARHPFLGGPEDWPKTPEETLEIGIKVSLQGGLR